MDICREDNVTLTVGICSKCLQEPTFNGGGRGGGGYGGGGGGYGGGGY